MALDALRCMDTTAHKQSQPSPQKPARSQQSRVLNFCKGLRGLCRDMLWLWPIETENAGHKKDFRTSEKESKAKNKIDYNDFPKVVISN